MAVSLTKGQKVDLTKGNPGLTQLLIGLGWDINKYDGGADFDLDASAFLCDENGKTSSDADFIFYGNLKHSSGSVEHTGDDRQQHWRASKPLPLILDPFTNHICKTEQRRPWSVDLLCFCMMGISKNSLTHYLRHIFTSSSHAKKLEIHQVFLRFFARESNANLYHI